MYHGNLAKLITLCGSLCPVCHLIPELSPVSLSISSLQGARHPGSVLCSLTRSLFIWASSPGTDCHGRLSQTHALSSPFYSIPSPQACLRLPACLEHTQGTQHTELFWSQSNRKSMEGGFLFLFFLERGKKFLQNPCKVFQCANTAGDGEQDLTARRTTLLCLM